MVGWPRPATHDVCLSISQNCISWLSSSNLINVKSGQSTVVQSTVLRDRASVSSD